LLHDIGMHISYKGHHRHSEYLIRNGELRGLEPDEVEVVALIARYHRRGRPRRSHQAYASLPKPLRKAVQVLAACAALAEGLDRSHAQVVQDVDVVVDGQACLLRLRCAADAELELWAGLRQVRPFARMLRRDVHFESSTPAAGLTRKRSPTSPRHRRRAEFTDAKQR